MGRPKRKPPERNTATPIASTTGPVRRPLGSSSRPPAPSAGVTVSSGTQLSRASANFLKLLLATLTAIRGWSRSLLRSLPPFALLAESGEPKLATTTKLQKASSTAHSTTAAAAPTCTVPPSPFYCPEAYCAALRLPATVLESKPPSEFLMARPKRRPPERSAAAPLTLTTGPERRPLGSSSRPPAPSAGVTVSSGTQLSRASANFLKLLLATLTAIRSWSRSLLRSLPPFALLAESGEPKLATTTKLQKASSTAHAAAAPTCTVPPSPSYYPEAYCAALRLPATVLMPIHTPVGKGCRVDYALRGCRPADTNGMVILADSMLTNASRTRRLRQCPCRCASFGGSA